MQNASTLNDPEYASYIDDGALIVLNKSDQVLPAEADRIIAATFGKSAARENVHIVSCTDGLGIDALIGALADTVKNKYVHLLLVPLVHGLSAH